METNCAQLSKRSVENVCIPVVFAEAALGGMKNILETGTERMLILPNIQCGYTKGDY